MKKLIFIFALVLSSLNAYSQNVLLDIDTGRTEGFFTKRAVYQRSIMLPAAEKSDTAVLFYPGWPGIVWITPNATSYPPGFNTPVDPTIFQSHNISWVMIDCPTDEWGFKSIDNPSACDDSYRSSKRHVEDVRLIINKLKAEFGISKIYLMGHSHGTISSKLIGKALGNEIEGVISSGAVTLQYRGSLSNFGWAGAQFDMKSITAPVLNIHHENDMCWPTPYSTVLSYSNNNLITVRGGFAGGDVCRAASYHSYGGQTIAVSTAIVNWIKTRDFPKFIGN